VASHVVARTLDARTVFAVAGPEDALYHKTKIDMVRLAHLVLATGHTSKARLLTVMTHSSGGFVAFAFRLLKRYCRLGPQTSLRWTAA
jgi:hypothetical protein